MLAGSFFIDLYSNKRALVGKFFLNKGVKKLSNNNEPVINTIIKNHDIRKLNFDEIKRRICSNFEEETKFRGRIQKLRNDTELCLEVVSEILSQDFEGFLKETQGILENGVSDA